MARTSGKIARHCLAVERRRPAIMFLFFGLLAWSEVPTEAIVLPPNHPANPIAPAGRPITVYPIRPSKVEEVKPDLGDMTPQHQGHGPSSGSAASPPRHQH